MCKMSFRCSPSFCVLLLDRSSAQNDHSLLVFGRVLTFFSASSRRRMMPDSEPPRRSAAASSTSLERSSRARAVEPWPHVCTCPRARTMQAKSGGRRTEAGADARLPMAHGSRRATRSYRVPVAGEGGARETPPRAPSTLALGHGSTIGSSTTYSSSSSSDAQSNGASHMRPCRLAAGPHIIGKGRAGLHPVAGHGVRFEVGARGGCAWAGWRRRAPPVAGGPVSCPRPAATSQ